MFFSPLLSEEKNKVNSEHHTIFLLETLILVMINKQLTFWISTPK